MVVHVIKRGGRGMPIVEDDDDRYRYIKCLYFLNDKNHPRRWERDIDAIQSGLHFKRPSSWPGEREPYVDILSYCLHDNHHHLLLQKRTEDGVHQFMKSLGGSMTQAYNEKHDGSGSIFAGRPKKKFVEDDEYLRRLFVYINIKNTFERLSGGLESALKDFDDAFTASLNYPFSSLPDLMGERHSPVVKTDVFNNLFSSRHEFKQFSKKQMNQYELFLDNINAKDLE